MTDRINKFDEKCEVLKECQPKQEGLERGIEEFYKTKYVKNQC